MGETEREHGLHIHASEATSAIQGHPLAPEAWHGAMEKPQVLVLCMVQPGGAIAGKKGVHRLLLVQAPNPRNEPFTEPHTQQSFAV